MVLLFFVINWRFQKSPAILINLSLSGGTNEEMNEEAEEIQSLMI